MRSSYGNRTHDSAVRGQRLNPLTNEPYFVFASAFCLTQVIYYQRIHDNASIFFKYFQRIFYDLFPDFLRIFRILLNIFQRKIFQFKQPRQRRRQKSRQTSDRKVSEIHSTAPDFHSCRFPQLQVSTAACIFPKIQISTAANFHSCRRNCAVMIRPAAFSF